MRIHPALVSPEEAARDYVEDRADLIRRATPGPAAAAKLSDAADRAVSAMAGTALRGISKPWALLALGGWGAGRLLPCSDLDLLVLTDASPEELRPAISDMLYPMWDAGLDVGHAVRSPKEHVRHARDDVDSLTATLTGRVLAGDRALGERVLAKVAVDAGRRAAKLLAALARRERPGSPYLLEPELKEGAGGQRDLDELVWTGAILGARPAGDVRPLLDLGVLTPAEAHLLGLAAPAITAARWEVHRLSTRVSALLSLDFADDCRIDLAATQSALADVHHVLGRVRARTARKLGRARAHADADGLAVAGGPESPIAPEALFGMLARGEVAELEEAAWAHRLDDALPGMGDLMTLRRPGLSHIFTVGAHSLRAAAIASTATPDDRLLAAAALLHDVGKVQAGSGHARRGATLARTLAPRLGMDGDDVRAVSHLIAEHLLLPETVATEDIHDEDVILQAASRAGDIAAVRRLYSLTAADSQATGPGVWTSWQAGLTGELAERMEAALAEGQGATARRAERHRAASLELAMRAAQPDAAVTRFIVEAHLRYLGARRPEQVLADALLAASSIAAGGRPRVSIGHGRASRTWTVTVAAADRPGLFAAIAGALSLSGLDILSADAYDAPGDLAFDVFTVRGDTLANTDEGTFAAFERYLDAALRDPKALATRVAARAADYGRGAARRPTTASVEQTGAYATSLFVTATDRVGLLYDLARTISEHDLQIRWARATTRGSVVRDTFHLVDSFGEPVTDTGVLGHLAMRIRELR